MSIGYYKPTQKPRKAFLYLLLTVSASDVIETLHVSYWFGICGVKWNYFFFVFCVEWGVAFSCSFGFFPFSVLDLYWGRKHLFLLHFIQTPNIGKMEEKTFILLYLWDGFIELWRYPISIDIKPFRFNAKDTFPCQREEKK